MIQKQEFCATCIDGTKDLAIVREGKRFYTLCVDCRQGHVRPGRWSPGAGPSGITVQALTRLP